MGSLFYLGTLAGCGNQAKASTPKTSGQPQLTRLTKQVKSLYADSKYEMPAKQLSEAALTKANTQRDKVYKLRAICRKHNRRHLKSINNNCRRPRKSSSVQDTFNTELEKDQVLKDEGFKIQAFNNDFTYLQAHKAKFAATIKDKATLLDREVKAVALVKAATTGDPDQTKIDQARDAINAVGVKAFKDKYLPKLDDAIKNLPKDQQAEQAKKQAVAGDSQISASTRIYDKDGNEVSTYDKYGNQIDNSSATQTADKQAASGQSSSASTAQSQNSSQKHNRLLAKCLAFPSSAKKQPERRRL